MAKLVILTQGMTDRSHELKAERTTIGRVEDNTFQIAEASVSSHHCEVLLRGNEVVIKDLNSTNGTFINNQKIAESVLKPGQTLRLGQVELRLDTGAAAAAPASAPAASSAPATAPAAPPPAPGSMPTPPKKPMTGAMTATRGVSLNELEQGGMRPTGFDSTTTMFHKKNNKGNKVFWIAAIVAVVVIVGLILYSLTLTGSGHR